jgi:TIR domain/YARHG domain
MSGRTFVSYSRQDADFALRLGKDLRDAGVDLWIDQLDIPPGRPWDREVEDALKRCEVLIVILSADSVASENVMVYARHGRRFTRADLQAYFDAQPWYRPLYDPGSFPERLLTSVQAKNAAFILALQRVLRVQREPEDAADAIRKIR